MDKSVNSPIVNVDKSLYEKSNTVSFTKSIQKQQKNTSIEMLICQKIYQIANFENLKFSPDLVLWVCDQIEVMVSKQDDIDKLELLVNIFKRVFQINPQEEKLITDLVEFIHGNRLIIEKGFWRFLNCFSKKKRLF